MAAKTIKGAIAQAFEKNDNHILNQMNLVQLRQDIVNEIQDYMAHEFMVYSAQVTNTAKDPGLADFISELMVGLFDRLFSGRMSYITEKEQDELQKRK